MFAKTSVVNRIDLKVGSEALEVLSIRVVIAEITIVRLRIILQPEGKEFIVWISD